MVKSVRIGNKLKSVRIKSYFLDFYSLEIGCSIIDAKKRAFEILERGCSLMPSRFVDADYVQKHMLLEIQEIRK